MKTREITFIAIMIALAIVLEIISSNLFAFVWNAGGHPSLSMIPIVIVAWKKGTIWAVLIAIVVGVAQVPYFYKPLQYMLDYPLAFAFLGLSAIFIHLRPKTINDERFYLTIGIIVASVGRYISHVLSGLIFFSDVINWASISYCLVYNSFVFITALLTIYVINIGFVQIKELNFD